MYRNAHEANALRWVPGVDNYYEIYYLTLNDLETRTGYWIRYTLHAPRGAPLDAYLEVWFTFFNHESPGTNFGIAGKLPIDALAASASPFQLKMGENLLENGLCTGSLSGAGHRVRWNLRFDSCDQPFLHFPERLYTSGEVESAMLSPHFSTRFSGTIEVDGRSFVLEGAPGEQSKTWGRQHPPRWLWAHCNSFEEDGEGIMELVSAPPRDGEDGVPVHVLYVKSRGREFRMLSLLDGSRSESDARPGHWNLKAGGELIRLEAEISCRPDDLIEGEYRDPNGAPSYCVHTEVGCTVLRLWERASSVSPWKELPSLRSRYTSHVEWGDDTPHSEVTTKVAMIS